MVYRRNSRHRCNIHQSDNGDNWRHGGKRHGNIREISSLRYDCTWHSIHPIRNVLLDNRQEYNNQTDELRKRGDR